MSQSRRRLFWCVTTLFFVVMLLSAEAAVSVYRIDGPKMLLSYLGYLSVASVCIGLIVWAMDRWCAAIFIPALSLGFAFLVFSLRLNFLSAVLDLSFETYLISFVFLWSMIWLALRAGVAENRVPKPGFIVAVFAVLAIPMIFSIGAFVTEATRRDSVDVKANVQARHALPAGWEKLRFVERPNIYLLSFDSLIPADVAAASLQIDRPDYYRLTTGLLRELPNSLVFKVPSMNSLNALMQLDQTTLNASESNPFVGYGSSLLGDIARLNSYNIVTAWPGYVPRWRRDRGGHRVIASSPSEFADESFLCEDGSPDSGRRIRIRGLFFCPSATFVGGFAPGRRAKQKPFRDIVLATALDVARGSQPVIFFAYVYDPIGHTSLDFDLGSAKQFIAYSNQFRMQSKLAGSVIERAIVSIRSVDPTAIILVFGDHGTYLSRGMNPSDDPKFVYADRHRVFLAVTNGGHPCGAPAQKHSRGTYNTPSRTLLDIMICLSGGSVELPVAFDEDPGLVRWVFQ